MNQRRIIYRQGSLCWLTFFLVIAVTEAGLASDRNPYLPIVQRNVFALTAPAPIQIISPLPAQPKAVLLGVSTIAGRKQGVFAVTDPPGPVPMPTAAEAWLLNEGQRRGPLEVLKIDVPGRRATVRLEGTSTILALK